MLYMKVKTVSPKNSHRKEKNIYFHFVSIWDNGCSLNLWASFYDICKSIIMFYTSNLYSALCELYISTIGRKLTNEHKRKSAFALFWRLTTIPNVSQFGEKLMLRELE